MCFVESELDRSEGAERAPLLASDGPIEDFEAVAFGKGAQSRKRVSALAIAERIAATVFGNVKVVEPGRDLGEDWVWGRHFGQYGEDRAVRREPARRRFALSRR